jgi:hypothetical protein
MRQHDLNDAVGASAVLGDLGEVVLEHSGDVADFGPRRMAKGSSLARAVSVAAGVWARAAGAGRARMIQASNPIDFISQPLERHEPRKIRGGSHRTRQDIVTCKMS